MAMHICHEVCLVSVAQLLVMWTCTGEYLAWWSLEGLKQSLLSIHLIMSLRLDRRLGMQAASLSWS